MDLDFQADTTRRPFIQREMQPEDLGFWKEKVDNTGNEFLTFVKSNLSK
jgi:hypothetical protein